jgi:hypothetical protein
LGASNGVTKTAKAKNKTTETRGAKAARTARLRRGSAGSAVVPPSAGHGRAPGVPNKLSRAAKETLEAAFEKMGGVDGLVTWGAENQTEFYKIWARLIPKDVSHSADATLEDLLTQLANNTKPAEQPGDSAVIIDAVVLQ